MKTSIKWRRLRYHQGLRFLIPALALFLLVEGSSPAAVAPPVSVQSIQVRPVESVPGMPPEVIGTIKANAPNGAQDLTIIVSVTQPNKILKSWTWKKVSLKPGEAKGFSIPKEYDVRSAGSYRIDFSIYSKDMRQLHKQSRNFTVIDPSRPRPATPPASIVSRGTLTPPVKPAAAPEASRHLGIGLYGNAVNTAGGATLMIWPSRHFGLQANYSVGSFTIAEGRLLVRFPLASGFNPYIGAGFASVSTERTVDVINIKTTLSGSGAVGVLGLELPFSKRIAGYLEVSGGAIDLKKEVTSGGITGTASVKYSPVTVGASIVYFAF